MPLFFYVLFFEPTPIHFSSMNLEEAFIQQVLEEEGKQLNDSQLRAIRKHILFKYGRSGRLENEREVEVSGNTLTLTHPVYQRFLDMKARLRNGKRRRKRYPIHNRIAMGMYSKIGRRLMYGFTDEAVKQIKKDFK